MVSAPTFTIIFPAPPPTTNTLTPQQRSQLLRSTNKLARVLGSTPQFSDESPSGTAVLLPFKDREFDSYSARSSMESISTTSSLQTSSLEPPRSNSSSISSSSLNSAKTWPRRSSSYSTDTKKIKTKPPVLKLAFPSGYKSSSSGQLPTIPASPLSPPPTLFASHTSFTLTPGNNSRDSLTSPSAPSFAIHTESSPKARLAKMDRLRRKLGDGVPSYLVFPSHKDGDADEEERSGRANVRGEKALPLAPIPPLPVTPIPIPSLRRSSSSSFHKRSLSHRDSLIFPSPHRAPRVGVRFEKQELAAIVECPDEHGNGIVCGGITSKQGEDWVSGWEDDFGSDESSSYPPSPSSSYRSSSSSSSSPSSSSRNLSPHPSLSETKIWSTRRGYEGWRS